MKPLQHLTILDLSRVLACPFASMILAELGATVIKVEQPGAGDETRGFEPQLARDSAYYFACNRSKASITVNLRSPGFTGPPPFSPVRLIRPPIAWNTVS